MGRPVRINRGWINREALKEGGIIDLEVKKGHRGRESQDGHTAPGRCQDERRIVYKGPHAARLMRAACL